MRTLNRPAFMALFCLVGMTGLTACSSSDDAGQEPTVNPGDAVKTSFTLSVGLPNGNRNGAKPATRVADNIAQENGNFRGIDNINLIPFNITGDVTVNDSRLGTSNITLPNAVNNSLASNDLTTTGNAKVYNDVSVPLTTNHFLFYGKAIDVNPGQDIRTSDEKFHYGTLTATGLSNAVLSDIHFAPEQIFTTALSDNDVANALVTYLNNIVATTYNPTSGASSSWSAYAADNGSRPLGQLYNDFVQQTSGSSTSIQDAVQDLFTSLENLRAGNGGNNLNADEMLLRNAIIASITNSTYVSNGTNPTSTTTLEFTDAIKNYPGNINLPDGAATLTFNNSTNTFSENSAQTTLARTSTSVPALNNYVYPANLWYFVNTPIRTSEAALSDQYQDNVAWSTILAAYGTSTGSVSAGTRSIALEKQIQYGVGRLHAVVKAAAATLKDGNGADVTVDDNTFPVNAIIIGGQRQVNWDFAPAGETGTQYTMYDKVSNDIHATTGNSTANNTLVLETPANEKINIVVELTNNSDHEFKGKDGMIPVGSKFYLVAELDPGSTTGNVDQPENGSLNQVFKQDYVTNANLSISVNDGEGHSKGLGAAYNVIPDLRTPVLSIGMSVDLTWQSGLTFNIDM